ncbi:MAG: hypothetical protein QOJ26_1076 [Thermoplasmata archaeon]|jgi:hypothetical protein|nr:hypothetical protein [Thermoplasmata archaeon]MEA3166207.1 hypothetical protein [Thermoplasmata archaeon]
MPTSGSPLGPSPRLHGIKPPFVGLLAALAFLAAAIGLDALVAGNGGTPGILLDWLPLVAAAAAIVLTVRSTGALREASITATIAVLALFAIANPHPQPWMYTAPLAAVLLVLGLTLAATTRMVAALPALAGALGALELLPSDGTISVFAIAVAGLFLLALWFAVPHYSGWRRVPFLAHLAAGLLIPAAFAAVIVMSLANDGFSTSAIGSFDGGPSVGTILAIAAAIAYPIAVVLLWRSQRAREFTLPSVAVPQMAARSRSMDANESSDQL